jgi:hypothetical protein
MAREEKLFQFCSSKDPDVRQILPSVEVCRQWLQTESRDVRPHKRKKQIRLLDDDDEGEDFFAFHAKPSKATKSSFSDLPDEVLHKAFIEGVGEGTRNREYEEHRALLYRQITLSFPKWMLQIQYAFSSCPISPTLHNLKTTGVGRASICFSVASGPRSTF